MSIKVTDPFIEVRDGQVALVWHELDEATGDHRLYRPTWDDLDDIGITIYMMCLDIEDELGDFSEAVDGDYPISYDTARDLELGLHRCFPDHVFEALPQREYPRPEEPDLLPTSLLKKALPKKSALNKQAPRHIYSINSPKSITPLNNGLRQQAENDAYQCGHSLVGWIRRFGLWITRCSTCGAFVIVDREEFGICYKVSPYFRPKIVHPIIDCGSHYEKNEEDLHRSYSWGSYDYDSQDTDQSYEFRYSAAINEYRKLIGDDTPSHVCGLPGRKRRIQLDREGGRIIGELITLQTSELPVTQAELIKIMKRKYAWSADRTKKQIKRCYNKRWLDKEYGENDKHHLVCYLSTHLTTAQLAMMRPRAVYLG